MNLQYISPLEPRMQCVPFSRIQSSTHAF